MFEVTVKTDTGEVLEKKKCTESSCTVGRSGRNFVSLDGWRIAGVHAELEQNAKGVYITDCSEGMTTKVNGEDVEKYGPIKASDEISIGNLRLTVSYKGADKPLAPQPVAEEVRQPVPVLDSIKKPDAYGKSSFKDTVGVRSRSAGDGEAKKSNAGHDQWPTRIHHRLMAMMDLRRTDVDAMDDEELTERVSSFIATIIDELGDTIPAEIDRDMLAKDVLNEAVGLGPLEAFLADDTITEIMVNRADDIYVERRGKLTSVDTKFTSDDAVISVIERIVSPLGRRIDESSPMVDARLKDGSRVNAIIPPLSINGPCLTIRKFSHKKLQASDMVAFGSMSVPMVKFLETAVRLRRNTVISGGTGSGKTTLLNVMSNFIPHTDRIVTVEDSAELKLAQPHVVPLEARPANMEGKGAVAIRDLVKNCLRMRPDRIVVGECRGGETLDMLQAMNTGHDGSLTTVHANSPRDLISRLTVMVMMAGMDLPEKAILEQISSAVHIVVQQARFADGGRRVTHITEITGMEGDVVQMQDIFLFKQQGYDEDGNVRGEYVSTGRVPEFYEEMRRRGIPVDLSIFK